LIDTFSAIEFHDTLQADEDNTQLDFEEFLKAMLAVRGPQLAFFPVSAFAPTHPYIRSNIHTCTRIFASCDI
jgi:hypothetical protein